MSYRPTTIQEKKAMSLEETLEKMTEAKERIWFTITKLSKKNKDVTALRAKHKSLVKGIEEYLPRLTMLGSSLKKNIKVVYEYNQDFVCYYVTKLDYRSNLMNYKSFKNALLKAKTSLRNNNISLYEEFLEDYFNEVVDLLDYEIEVHGNVKEN